MATSDHSKNRLLHFLSARGFVSHMNDTKWRELQSGVRNELLFPPAYQIKYVLSDGPEPERFDSDPGYWGDWSDEALRPFDQIEWIRIRPRYPRRRGAVSGADGWSVESDLLEVLHRWAIPYRYDGESVWVYGYAIATDAIEVRAVDSAPRALRPLAESPRFLLGHVGPDVVLREKVTGGESVLGRHRADPQAGAIARDEKWFVSAGDGVLCHAVDGMALTFFRPGHPPFGERATENAVFVHDIRLSANGRVRVRLRPWAGYASIWEIDLESGDVTKRLDDPFPRRTWWSTDW